MVGNDYVRVHPVLWDGPAPSGFGIVSQPLWHQFYSLTDNSSQCDARMPHDAEDIGGPTGCLLYP